MFSKFFEHYPNVQIEKNPSTDYINSYQDKLPPELLQLWAEHGFGTYMNGYLRLVDPMEFDEFLKKSVNVYVEGTLVFAVSALGDFFLWEGDRIKQVNYRYGYTDIVGGRRFASFLNHRLTDKDYQKEIKASVFFEVVESLGIPDFDECYGYVPALILGGSADVSNLQRLKMREHLQIVSDATGVIE